MNVAFGSGYAFSFCISRPPPTIAALGRRALAGHHESVEGMNRMPFGRRLTNAKRPLSQRLTAAQIDPVDYWEIWLVNGGFYGDLFVKPCSIVR